MPAAGLLAEGTLQSWRQFQRGGQGENASSRISSGAIALRVTEGQSSPGIPALAPPRRSIAGVGFGTHPGSSNRLFPGVTALRLAAIGRSQVIPVVVREEIILERTKGVLCPEEAPIRICAPSQADGF